MKTFHIHGLESASFIKMVIIPQIDLQIQYSAYWNSTNLFPDTDKPEYKINIEISRTQNSQNILGGEKRTKLEVSVFPILKLTNKQQ